MGSILGQLQSLRCPSCGGQLDEGMVRGLAAEGERLLIQLACATCGERTLAIIEQVLEDLPEEARPVTEDDVLDAHDILCRSDGLPEGLLGTAA
jgi:hypothetical protein